MNNGWFCPEWVSHHWHDTLQPALIQHIELTVIAVAIGFVIAFALALLGFRYRLLDPPIGLVSDFLYTIPSLALFQLLIPITGISVTTVEIALVSYTLLVLYRNMVEGLRNVPAELVDVARGSGFTRSQTFLRVELPLALPAILAGLRIATVSTISIATVASFVVAKGLGQPDLHRARAGRLQDGDLHGGRHGGCTRARRRRAARAPPARADAVGEAREDGVNTFVDAFRFMGDHHGLLLTKTEQHLELSAAALGDRAPARAARRPLARAPAPRLSSRLRASRTSAARCRASCSSPSA